MFSFNFGFNSLSPLSLLIKFSLSIAGLLFFSSKLTSYWVIPGLVKSLIRNYCSSVKKCCCLTKKSDLAGFETWRIKWRPKLKAITGVDKKFSVFNKANDLTNVQSTQMNSETEKIVIYRRDFKI